MAKRSRFVGVLSLVLVIAMIFGGLQPLQAFAQPDGDDGGLPDSPNAAASEIVLSDLSVELEIGDTYTLTYRLLPEDAEPFDVEWTTSDADVATVENGIIIAAAQGTAEITAYNTGDETVAAVCVVEVVAAEVVAAEVVAEEESDSDSEFYADSGIVLSDLEIELQAGQSHRLTYSLSPGAAELSGVEWLSSSEKIAVVEDGLITAVGAGSAKIMVRAANDAGRAAICAVKVVDAEAPDITGNTVAAMDESGEPAPMEYVLSAREASMTFSYSAPQAAVQALDPGTKVDLVFIIDDSGSMSGYINNVKKNITEFVKSIQTEDIEIRIGIVMFRDSSESSSRVITVNGSVWHKTYADVIESLDKALISGGIEPTLDALGLVTSPVTGSFSWDPQAIRHCVLITDEWMETAWNRHGYTTLQDVINDAVSMGISISVVTTQNLMDEVSPLTDATGGMIANISDSDYSGFFLEFASGIKTATTMSYTLKLQTTKVTGNPTSIANETIKINNAEYKTDEDGVVKLPTEDNLLRVEVAAHNDYIFPAQVATDKQKTVLLKHPEGENTLKPYISSVHIRGKKDHNGNVLSGQEWADLAVQGMDVIEGGNATYDVIIYTVWRGHSAGKIYLEQDGAHKISFSPSQVTQVNMTDGDGNPISVSAATLTDVQLGQYFEKGKKVYAYAQSDDSTYTEAYPLKLTVTDWTPPVISLKEIKLFDSSGTFFTISDDIPVLGGTKFGMDFASLPVSLTWDSEGTYKLAVGFESDFEGDEWDLYKQSVKAFEKTENLKAKLQRMKDLQAVFGGGKVSNLEKTGSFFDDDPFVFSAVGYVEFKFVDKKIVVTDSSVQVGAKIDGKRTWRNVFMVWVVPVPYYTQFGFAAELNLEGKASRFLPDAQIPVEYDVDMHLKPEVSLGGGLGHPGALSGGLEGKAELDWHIQFLRKYQKVMLNLSLTLKGSFGPFSGKKEIGKGLHIPLYDNYWGASGSLDISDELYYPEYNIGSLYDMELFDGLVRRDYSNQWLGGVMSMSERAASVTESGVVTLAADVYPDSRHRLVQFNNGQKMLVWLDDAGGERSDINRTVLVYSLYNASSDAWSAPVPIADVGRADFYPRVATDGFRVYVTWQNTKTVLSDDASASDYAAAQEICAAVYYNGSFSAPITITANDTLDMLPVVAADGGDVWTVWINNDANDPFGFEGANTIWASKLSGSAWSEPRLIADGLTAVHSLDATVENGKLYVAYAYDMDNNYDDINDLEIFQISVGGDAIKTTRLTANDVMDSAPRYGTICGNRQLFWYSESNLRTLQNLDGNTSVELLDSGAAVMSDEYAVAQSNLDVGYIVWAQPLGDHTAFYAIVYDGSSWSDPVPLGSKTSRAVNPSAIVEDDGTFFIAFNDVEQILQTDPIENQPDSEPLSYYADGKTDLRMLQAKQDADLSVSDDILYITYDMVVPDRAATLSVTVRNDGLSTVGKARILVDGKLNSIQSLELAPGRSKEVSFAYIFPQDITERTLTIEVLPDGTQEATPEDNTVSVSYGYPELSVTEAKVSDLGTQKLVGATVENLSYADAGSFSVLVREDSLDGDIVKRIEFDGLEARSYVQVSHALDKADVEYDETLLKKYYIEIVTDEREYTKGNNSELATFEQESHGGTRVEVLRLAAQGARVGVYGAVYNNELAAQAYDVKIEALNSAGHLVGSAVTSVAPGGKSSATIDVSVPVTDADAVELVRISLHSPDSIPAEAAQSLPLNTATQTVIDAQSPDLCRIYSYTPAADGLYKLESTGSSGALGFLYDSNGKLIVKAAPDASDGDFELTYSLTAGQKYYYKIVTPGTSTFDGIKVQTPAHGTASVTLTKLSDATTLRTVTYDYSKNGGDSASVTSAYVAQGSNIDLTPTAVKEGWVFLGWNTDSDASFALSSLKMGGENITLYAIFTNNSSVSFTDYSGTSKSTRTIALTLNDGGDSPTVTLPPQNACAGWTSMGWTTDTSPTATAQAKGGESLAVTGGESFYGLYRASVTLTYNANSGSGAPANDTKYRSFNSYDKSDVDDPQFTLGNAPTRSNYTFKGWAKGSVSGEISMPGDSVTLTEDTTFYAVWENSATYTVTYNANGGTGGTYSQTKYHGQTLNLTTNAPSRLGFTFLGWGTDPGDTTATYLPGGAFDVDAATTLYAVWSEAPALQLDAETTVTMPLYGVYNHYAFTPDTTGAYAFTASEHSSHSVYLQIYGSSGSSIASGSGSADFTVSAILTEGQPYYIRIYHSYSGQTVTAKLTASRSYAVTYDINGGTGTTPQNQYKMAGTSVTITATLPTRFGYTFRGWASSASAAQAEYLPGDDYWLDADLSLYAVWTPAPAITLDNPQTVTMPLSGSHNYYAFKPAKTGRYGFSATGYTDGTLTLYLLDASQRNVTYSSSSADFYISADLSAGETYYLRLHHSASGRTVSTQLMATNAYTVSYDANGGSSAPTAQYKPKGTAMTLTTSIPSRSGYTFLGWAKSKSAASADYARGDIFTTDADTTLYAVWSNGTTYTVGYNANGGSGAPTAQNKASGVALKLSSAVPTRANHTFLGWATASSATEPEYQPGASFTADANTTLYAVWKILTSYQVAYDARGGTGAPSAQTKYHGTALTLSTGRPTRIGHEFRGWADKNDSHKADWLPGSVYTLDADITLYAVWLKPISNMTLDDTYRTEIDFGGANRVYVFSPEKTAPYAFTVSGQSSTVYLYLYDSAGNQLTYSYGSSAFTLTRDLTAGETYYFNTYYSSSSQTGSFNATLTSAYKVTYDANGGTGAPAEQTKVTGSALTLQPGVPSKTGCTFLGWSTSQSADKADYLPGGYYTQNASTTLYAVWENAAVMTLNTPATTDVLFGRQYRMYKFVPETDGTYAVTTSGHSATAYAYIYDAAGNRLAYTSSSGTFSLSCAMTAGETYYIQSNFSSNTQLGSFTVKLTETYRITYDANGGTGGNPSAQDKPHGEPVKLSANIPTRFAYNFLGWSDDASATTVKYKPGADYSDDQNVTLYAVWRTPASMSLNTPVAVNIDVGGDSQYVSFTPKNGGTYCFESGDIINVNKRGYLFDSSGKQVAYDTSYGAGNGNFAVICTLQAGETYYCRAQYTNSSNTGSFNVRVSAAFSVQYDANGGKNPPPTQSKAYENVLTLSSTVPTRFGHTFLGWSANPSASVPTYMPGGKYFADADIILYAVWGQAAVLSPNTPVTANIGFANQLRYFTFTPAQTAKYRFYSLEQGATDPYGILYNSSENQLAYNNNYDSGSNNFGISYDLNAGETYYLAVRMNNTANTGTFKVRVSRSYTVTYDANGGSSSPAAQLKDEGSPLTLTTGVPSRLGYNFLGWATAGDADTAEILPGGSYSSDADITYYAVWKASDTAHRDTDYTVSATFPNDSACYEFIADETATYRFYATGAPLAGTRLFIYNESGGTVSSGYSASGNASISAGLTAGQRYFLLAKLYDAEQTGSFKVRIIRNNYTVTYDANGGTGGPSTQSKTAGISLTLSSLTPTRSGYTFMGWALSSTSSDPRYMPQSVYTEDADITLYAVWTDKDTYTISFNANGGSGAPRPQTKAKGKALVLSMDTPTRTGYRFLGWATASTATTAQYKPGASFTADENTTLYAVWQPLSTYTVAYDANGGASAPKSQTKYEDAALTLTTDLPVYMGREFLGWAENAAASEAAYLPGQSFTTNKSMTLYAVWGSAPPAMELYMVYPISIALGGEAVYYTFTPETGGYYRLISSDNGTVDPMAELYAVDGTLLSRDDDSGSGSNFKLEYLLKAGQEYCYKVSLYDREATGGFKIQLTIDTSTYAVVYDANGGTGAPDPQMAPNGTAVTLSKTIPTRFEHTFLGWSDDSSAVDAKWLPGDTYEDDVSVTLYAVWQSGRRLVPGTPLTVNIDSPGDAEYIIIAPEETRQYRIFSTDNTGDPYLILYDSNGVQLGDDDDGGQNKNFSLTETLIAGKTYVIQVQLGDDDTTGSFTVNLEGLARQVSITATAGSGGSVSGGGEYPENATVTLTATPNDGCVFEGWYENGTLVHEELSYSFTAISDRVLEARFKVFTAGIGIAPSHVILANETDTAVLAASLLPDGADDYDKITWSVDGDLAGNILSITPAADGRSAQIQVLDVSEARTMRVRAVYDGIYAATATVEILPYSLASDRPSISLLETKVTVNKAKTVGALVPVLITYQQPQSDPDMSGTSMQRLMSASAGTLVIEDVRLLYYDRTAKDWQDVPGFVAQMCATDARYLEITAEPAAKNTGNVKVMMKPSGAAEWIEAAENVSLNAVEKYPKITLTAGELNLAFPNRGATLTATSDDGVCTITDVAFPDDTLTWDWVNGMLRSGGLTKASTVTATVEVAVEGYIKPYKTAPKARVKVVDSLPKLKLSATSVTLADSGSGNDTAKIQLVSADKKVPFESGYRVENVAISGTDAKGKTVTNADVAVSYDKATGMINVASTAGTNAGSALLKVTIEGAGAGRDVYLTLKVSVAAPDRITPTVKVKAVTVSKTHGTGKIIDIPVLINAANYTDDEWEILEVKKGRDVSDELDGVIGLTPGENQITLSVLDGGALSDLAEANGKNTKYVLTIGSDGIKDSNGRVKTFEVTLTVAAADAGFTVSLKNKIDIASPGSAITATVKPTNTTSAIQSVKLWNSKSDAAPTEENTDFQVIEIAGNTFKIVAAHNRVVPSVSQKLALTITLENGQELNSWMESVKNGVTTVKDKPVTITPTQKTGKAYQSKKAVTLYTSTPLTGESVILDLTTPAGIKLGAVRLNQAGLDALKLTTDGSTPSDAFRLERRGEREWTLLFDGDKVPQTPIKSGKQAALKSVYTVKLELWAEGTYDLDGDGMPIALGIFDSKTGRFTAKSKPTPVSVKVNIK